MNPLKLYRGTDVIGIVTNPEVDWPHTVAALELTDAAANHRDVIDYIMSTKDPGEDPPESLNLWNDWFIEDENGEMKAIHPPGIRPDTKFISWRWKR